MIAIEIDMQRMPLAGCDFMFVRFFSVRLPLTSVINRNVAFESVRARM